MEFISGRITDLNLSLSHMDAVSPSSVSSLYQTSQFGMTAARKRMDDAVQRISRGGVSANDLVQSKTDQHIFAANAKVLKTADEMTGTLLNELR